MAGPRRASSTRFRLPAVLAATLALLASGAVLAAPAGAVNPPLTITATTLPAGNVSAAYAVALTASGGALPWTWSLASGSLPPGLTLDGGGIISGTPTTAGTFLFTPRVTDGASATATQPLSITINPPLTITTTTLPDATVGVPYSQTLTENGGTAPFAWSLFSGGLPAGLTESAAGVISGTPTGAGTFPFTVQLDDGVASSTTQPLLITVHSALSITTPTLPDATVGVPYSVGLSANGGTPGYTWLLSGGALPAGLTLSTAGVVSGTPTTAGPASFTVHATDTATGSATKPLTITVAPAAPPALAITTTTLAGATIGTPYSATLTATGGTPGYTWTVSAGSLPAGLTLTTAGVISGTPTAATTADFTVQATDTATGSATKPLTITVSPVITPPLTITTATLPAAVVGTPYSASLAATGGNPPYAWSLANGALPAGLTVDGAGVISGTPTVPGPSAFTARVADDPSAVATRALSIAVTMPAADSGITLVADNLSPHSRDRVTLTAQVTKPPAGRYFVVIVDVTRSRLVGICGAHTTCRTHVRHRAGVHTYEARLVAARWGSPWRTLATSPRTTVTWSPPVLVIQHGHEHRG